MKMASPDEFPELRNQFEVVVGSLENILSELQGVAADLKVVVNQIDDVTNQIESSHSSPRGSKVNRSMSSTQFTATDPELGAICKQQQRVSMDSGIQDVTSSPDYVNIDALHLELSSILGPKFCAAQSTTKPSSQSDSEPARKKIVPSQGDNCQQDIYRPSNILSPDVNHVKPQLCYTHRLTAGIDKSGLPRPLSNRHKQLNVANVNREIYSRVVKKKSGDSNRFSPQSSILITTDTHKGGPCGSLHKGTIMSSGLSYRTGARHDSVSDIYERRFEEQLEMLGLEQSIDDVTADRHYFTRKGWSSSSAISDPIDLSEQLLEVVRFDDDTAYETDDNASEVSAASTYSRAIGMRPSDTFKYKVRQQLAPRRNSGGPSWRVVIEP